MIFRPNTLFYQSLSNIKDIGAIYNYQFESFGMTSLMFEPEIFLNTRV